MVGLGEDAGAAAARALHGGVLGEGDLAAVPWEAITQIGLLLRSNNFYHHHISSQLYERTDELVEVVRGDGEGQRHQEEYPVEAISKLLLSSAQSSSI